MFFPEIVASGSFYFILFCILVFIVIILAFYNILNLYPKTPRLFTQTLEYIHLKKSEMAIF